MVFMILIHHNLRDGLPDDYVTIACGLTLPVDSKPCKIKDIINQSKNMENYEELNDGLNDFMRSESNILKIYFEISIKLFIR